MKSARFASIDFNVVAENLLITRTLQGITQVELAARAKVSVPSIYRVEKAQSVRLSTLKQIAEGLNVTLASLLFRKLRVHARTAIVIHRAAEASWQAMYDFRHRIPEDSYLQYQDRNERARLGHLGFVPCFMAAPTSIMEDGPGFIIFELFTEIRDAFNDELYKNGVLYVVRGKAEAVIGTEEIEISEGDWVGYRAADLVRLRSAELTETPGHPAVVLWIGANRITKRRRAPDRVPVGKRI